jgi:hypothetical protein
MKASGETIFPNYKIIKCIFIFQLIERRTKHVGTDFNVQWMDKCGVLRLK